MLRALIEKEWKSVLLSPKFAATFAVTAALILLSIAIGVGEYRAFEAQQAAGQRLLAEEHLEQTSWVGLSTRIFRGVDPLHIFAGGVHHDIGRLARISNQQAPLLQQSIYSDDSILAMFRSFDLSLVVQLVLSLFAILFTYDALSGEREAGTLRLMLSNAVPRSLVVLAKFLGTWLALAVPFTLPVLLGLLAIVLAGIPLDGGQWQRIALLLLASGLYFTVFMAFGIAVSALTRRSSTAFLVLLVSWVLLVLVIPRIGLLAAVYQVPVPTVAEIESQKAGFETRQREAYRRQLEATWIERQRQMAGLDEAGQEAYEDANLWRWLEEDEAARKRLETDLAQHAMRLDEDLRHRKAQQEQLAFSLSRLSPASAYRLVAMRIAGSGIELKERYETAARGYLEAFSRFVDEGSGGGGDMVIRRRGSGHRSSFMGTQEPLDLSDMPRFDAPRRDAATLVAALPDLGLLATQALACFAVGFVAFLRYDVR
ncbi:MAG: ABC transporter permease subunit [Acidobacteriota bacterium]